MRRKRETGDIGGDAARPTYWLPDSLPNLVGWFDFNQCTPGRLSTVTDLSGTGNGTASWMRCVEMRGKHYMTGGQKNGSYLSFNAKACRTVVQALQFHNDTCFFLSDSKNYDFHGHDDYLCEPYYAHADVKGGSWRVNGISKNPTTDHIYTLPQYNKMLVVSCVVANGPRSMNRLGFDRTYTPVVYLWGETIIYSDAKTAAQVRQIEHYLAVKWEIENFSFDT